MGPDLELKGRLDSMASLDGKENGKSLGEPLAKNISCVSNYQDNIFELEDSPHKQAEKVNQVEKSEVKIMECTHQRENPLNDTASQDETENSSSFGDTLSVDEDENLSDSEVMSKLRDNGFDEDCRIRKKRLTSHWKTFIQPYMWRCRWAELQIRRLLYQASKYDLQAEAISRRQQLTSENMTVEDTGAKLFPVSQKEKLIERRKRKRVEDTTDTAAYMTQHNFFSFLGSKKSAADVAAFVNDRTNIGIPTDNRIKGESVFGCSDEPVSLEFRNDDNSLEQILWKIGVLQSHLSELKTRCKKVWNENAQDIYSADVMKLYHVSTSSAQYDVLTNEGEKLVHSSSTASQLMPKCNMCDVLISGSAIPTHGEATDLIDIIECNDQLQIGISCENDGDGHLIYNSTAKELNNIEKVEIQPTEKLETPKEEQANIVPSVPVPVISIADDEPTQKKRSISSLTSPHNARKRGRGRRRGGRWSRRA